MEQGDAVKILRVLRERADNVLERGALAEAVRALEARERQAARQDGQEPPSDAEEALLGDHHAIAQLAPVYAGAGLPNLGRMHVVAGGRTLCGLPLQPGWVTTTGLENREMCRGCEPNGARREVRR